MTERDVVLRERAAFVRGLGMDEFSDRSEALACQLYPLPKITRPRVVADPHAHSTSWMIRDGELTVLFGPVAKPWSVSGPNDGYKPTPERITIWADLLAQPTETVDA